MRNQVNLVQLFHEKFNAPVANSPMSDIPQDRKDLRFNLMKEENEEYQEAVKANDLIGIADALGDMMYILCGTIVEHGLQNKIEEVFNEIHLSNMSKLGEDGKPIYREDGKVMKGPNYFKPNIAKILENKKALHKPSNKKLISIAALSANEVIAKDGKIPWYLPEDLQHFKDVTNGSFIIMGRKTFQSLPFILPNRVSVVITRSETHETLGVDPALRHQVIIVNSLQEAIDNCPENCTSYVIGGGEVYREAMDIVDELDLTIVDTIVTGENLTYFPPAMLSMGQFKVVSKLDSFYNSSPTSKELNFSFIRLVRK
jgi:dihydrofolate reductase